MSDWQPIATAPKDGTRILAWFPLPDSCSIIQWVFNEYDDSEDWTLDDFESARLTFDDPTHWMPLPTPPTT